MDKKNYKKNPQRCAKSDIKKFITSPLSVTLLAGCTLLSCGQVSANEVVTGGAADVPTLGSDSAYTVTTGTADDYNYSTVENDGTTNYYKINLNLDNIGTSDSIKWGTSAQTGDVTGSVKVQLPNSKTQTLYYGYTKPSGYDSTTYSNQTVDKGTITVPISGSSSSPTQVGSGLIQNTDTTGNVNYSNYLFSDNTITATLYRSTSSSSSSYSAFNGTILNNSGVINNLNSDFIDNKLNIKLKNLGSSNNYRLYGYANGGALYNNGTIYNITSNFINNYVLKDDGGTAGLLGYAQGGAIYNNYGTINNITGDFIGNYVHNYGWADEGKGGAIYNNYGTIVNITGNFINNSASASYGGFAYGGAIYNYYGNINNISANFVNNYVSASSSAYGGAIMNAEGTIDSIIGDFISNYTSTVSSDMAFGGAIYNTGTINKIDGSFIDNYSLGGLNCSALGGAISNWVGLLGNINGNFIGNYVLGARTSGGAINNSATITSIIGDFIDNYSSSTSAYPSSGGAIANGGYIKTLNGDFIGNHVISGYSAKGGAIYNEENNGIGLTNNRFLNNYTQTNGSTSQGGAIYTGRDLTITADNGTTEFTGNYITTDNGITKNYEAIYVDPICSPWNYQPDTLTLISKNNGTFIMNDYINGNSEGYNIIMSADDTSKFYLNNIVKGSPDVDLTNVTVNWADKTLYDLGLASLDSTNSTYKIDMDLSNVIDGTTDYTVGQVADGITTRNTSTGYVTLESLNFLNGSLSDVLNKELKIQIIQNNDSTSTLQLKLSNNLNKYMTKAGVISKILVSQVVKDITPVVNYKDVFGIITTTDNIYGTLGLATTNTTNDSIGMTIKDIVTNVDTYKVDALAELTKTEFKDSDGSILDKIFNVYDVDSDGNKTPGTYTLTTDLETMTNGKLTINGVNGSTIDFDGKKAFELGDINGTTTLNLNDITLKNGKDNNVINVSYIDETINLNNSNIEGNIEGSKNYNLNVTGDSSVSGNITKGTVDLKSDNTKLTLNNSTVTEEIKSTGKNTTLVTNGTTNLQDKVTVATLDNKGTTSVGKNLTTTYIMNDGNLTADDDLVVVTLTNKGTVNINKGMEYTKITSDTIGKLNINNSTVNQSGVIENQNVNLNNSTMTLGNFNNFTNNGLSLNNSTFNVGALGYNTLNLNNLSMVNNSTMNISSVNVNLATEKAGRISANNYGTIADSAVNVNALNIVNDAKKETTNILFADKGISNIVNYSGSKEYVTPIYKYNVSYKNDLGDNNGYFQFVRGSGGNSSSYDSFNSAVTSPIAALSGAKSVLNETFQYVFEHADGFTQLPSNDRFAKIHENEYAMSTDFNTNLGSFNYEESNKGVWVRPFATFENVPLKNGPKLDSITYGTLIGYDGNFKTMKRGWHRLGTTYIGYNGAQISYSGNHTSMNGGLIGLTETFYKGNFWSALTLSTGATVGETSTMYGNDNYTSLMAGIGTKTGYNFEFKGGRYILQPIWNMSYTFVKTFDYTNAAGVRMDVEPNNSIQFHPMIRFIANYKNGWQPYARIGMVWNVMGETNATANGIRLPETSVKPYFEYGLGIQKQWKDSFTGFLQAMVRNGGRNGIALTTGFRWALGKDGKPIEKVEAPTYNEVVKSDKTLKVSNRKAKIKITNTKQASKQVSSNDVQQAITTRTIIKQLSTKDKKYKDLL